MDCDTTDRELRRRLDRLSVRQVQFVIARLEAKSDAEAARAVGIRPQTVCGWRNRKDVRRAVRLALEEVLTSMQGELVALAKCALAELEEQLQRSASRAPPGGGLPAVKRAPGRRERWYRFVGVRDVST